MPFCGPAEAYSNWRKCKLILLLLLWWGQIRNCWPIRLTNLSPDQQLWIKPMTTAISSGIHHITAIAGDARRNHGFYTDALGLRMVKKTVNFDDPGTYHLYYGDEAGSPGTIMTFFPWAGARPGRRGAGEASETAFAVPNGSLDFWLSRFTDRKIAHTRESTPFGDEVIAFADPDGMAHHLIATDTVSALPGYTTAGVPAEHAIRGFFGITLWSSRPEITAAVLSVMGYTEEATVEGASRWMAPANGLAARIDVRDASQMGRGQSGAGSIHHVAFRAADDKAQEAMVAALRMRGLSITEQLDRNYFRSVYFREPGGTLFEIATDDPGFAVDEPAATLGQALKLPEWLENSRGQIEAALPALV
jgi:glyoxalase family protein